MGMEILGARRIHVGATPGTRSLPGSARQPNVSRTHFGAAFYVCVRRWPAGARLLACRLPARQGPHPEHQNMTQEVFVVPATRTVIGTLGGGQGIAAVFERA
jgi:hypothetical protein